MKKGIAFKLLCSALFFGGAPLVATATTLQTNVCWVVCGGQEIELGFCAPPSYCCFYWDCAAGVGNLTCCSQSESCHVVYVWDPPRAECFAQP